MKKTLPEPIFYTLQEVAALLKVSYNSVYDLVVTGKMKSIRVGSQYRILKIEFWGNLEEHYGEEIIRELVS